MFFQGCDGERWTSHRHPGEFVQRGGCWPTPSSSRGGAGGREADVASSNAFMRDVRSMIDLLRSAAILSAVMLQVLVASTVLANLSYPAWSALTSVSRRSSFSSAVVILEVRVGGFFSRCLGLGGGGGRVGVGELCGGRLVEVDEITSVNNSSRTRLLRLGITEFDGELEEKKFLFAPKSHTAPVGLGSNLIELQLWYQM